MVRKKKRAATKSTAQKKKPKITRRPAKSSSSTTTAKKPKITRRPAKSSSTSQVKKPKAPTKKSSKKGGTSETLLTAARAILPRLEKGETTLSFERDRLGLKSNGPLRKALTKLLGGKQKYQQMMAAGRPERTPKGNKNSAAQPKVSDENIPKIPSAKHADGWRSTTITIGGRREDLFTAPDGKQYVKAVPGGRTDLLVETSIHGLGIVRLRLYVPSTKAKQVKEQTKLMEHAEKTMEANRENKKQVAKKKKEVRRKT